MKRTALLTALAFSLSVSAKTYHHDFGTIREDGGVVKHEFLLAPANKPFSIVSALPGCPCIKANYPKTVIPKGKQTKITVTYDPKDQNRHFTKSVYLRRSDGQKDTLMVTGTVKRTREAFDKAKYAYDFGMGLRLTTDGINIGTVKAGQTKAISVPMINSYQAGMQLNLESAGRDGAMIEVPYGLILPPLQEAVFKIEVIVPANAAKGTFNAALQPTINGRQIDSIPVTGTIR